VTPWLAVHHGVVTDPERSSEADLALAEREIASLLHKCEAALEGSALSPSRQTLMVNRVAALRTALGLIRATRRSGGGDLGG
jgi:hypothetical protein